MISVGAPDFVSLRTGRVIDSEPEVVLEALVPSNISCADPGIFARVSRSDCQKTVLTTIFLLFLLLLLLLFLSSTYFTAL